MGFTLTHAITEPYKLLNIKLHTRKLLASVCELKYLAVWHEPEKLRRYGPNRRWNLLKFGSFIEPNRERSIRQTEIGVAACDVKSG